MIFKALATVGLFPFVGKWLTPAELAIWSVFLSLQSLQLVIESGMTTVFIRTFAYARSGHASVMGPPRDGAMGMSQADGPNWEFFAKLERVSAHLYGAVGVSTSVFLAVWGGLAIWARASQLATPSAAWISLIALTIVGGFRAYSGRYQSILYGFEKIPHTRLTEATAWAICFFSTLAVLTVTRNLLFTSLVYAAGQLLFPLLLVPLRKKFIGTPQEAKDAPLDRGVLRELIDPLWRSIFGVFLFLAVFFGTGLIISTSLSSTDAAHFLLLINLSRYIMQFAQVPFVVAIPALAYHYASGKRADLMKSAESAMAISLWILVSGLLLTVPAARIARHFLHIDVGNIDLKLWGALSIATFLERHGAMHLQLYSTTNHIVWHQVNGIAAVIFVALTAALVSWWGPWAWIAGYFFAILYYDVRSCLYSYKAFQLPIPEFELRTSVGPLVVGVGILVIGALRIGAF
jgi:hypothetical protein